MVIAKTDITINSERNSLKNPYKAIEPINNPQIKLVIIKIFFLEYLSIKEPAYIPQKSVIKVITMYEYAKNSGWSIISIKYHGMAIILIPWANPEMILDKKSNVIACLFFIPANLRLLTRLCTFDI